MSVSGKPDLELSTDIVTSAPTSNLLNRSILAEGCRWVKRSRPLGFPGRTKWTHRTVRLAAAITAESRELRVIEVAASQAWHVREYSQNRVGRSGVEVVVGWPGLGP